VTNPRRHNKPRDPSTPAQEEYREQVLKILRRDVETYSDCTEPDKPVYHDLYRLSRKHPTFTGYPNATPIWGWTEQKRLWYWGILKGQSRRRLREFEHGIRRSSGELTTLSRRRSNSPRMRTALQHLEQAGESGLSLEELHEKVYGGPARNRKDQARVWALLHRMKSRFGIQRARTPIRFRLRKEESAKEGATPPSAN
jgi:hypothetical protein